VVDSHRLYRVCSLSTCAAAIAYTTPAAAHGGGGAETGVPFWLLLVSSAGGGLAGGILLARTGWRFLSGWVHDIEWGVHLLVSLIGLTIVVPPLTPLSVSGAVGTLIGGSLAGAAVVVTNRQKANGLLAVATGGVGVHRAAEGFALAAAYLSGTAIGVVSALALTAHAAFEISVICAGEIETSPRRALLRGAGVQSLLLVSGTLGMLTGGLPDVTRSAVLSVVGGALIVTGICGVVADASGGTERTEPD
jgi:zinc transporter ZupT